MFCPECGSIKKDYLFGGNCNLICENCGNPLNCYDIFEKKLKTESILIWNPFKALWLNLKYRIKK